jgi:hypothetical protein
MRDMIGNVLGRILTLERGFIHTAVRLTLSPGRVVRDYLGGRTVPYTHPFAYLLISFAAFTLLAQMIAGARGGFSGENRLFTLLLVPFIAGISWLLFWRTSLNFAEHLIIEMYLLGHIALLFALMQVLVPVVDGGPYWLAYGLAFGALGTGVGYYVWAFGRIFDSRPIIAAVGGFAALAAGIALWSFALVGLFTVLRS